MTSLPIVMPSSSVGIASYPPGTSYGPRRSADYEFVWILRGSALWRRRSASDQPESEPELCHPLRPGALALARPGAVDSYRWDTDVETVHGYVHFAVEDPGALPPEPKWPLVRSMSEHPVLDGLCQYLVELAGNPRADARRRSDQLLGVLLDLFVAGPFGAAEAALAPAVAAVVEAVRQQWRTGLIPVPVPALAAAAGVSPGHLFRIFRTEYGCSPARALEIIRLARAAILLQRSNATIAEVAHRSGFANPYHFSRRFAAVYGQPPGRYRGQLAIRDPYDQVRQLGLLPIARGLLRG